MSALVHGFVMRTTDHEIGWLALGIGAAVAFAPGRLGGRNPVLPAAGTVLALLGVLLGQLFGVALHAHQELGYEVTDLLGGKLHLTFEAWKASRGVMDVLFYGIAGYEGFVPTRRIGSAA
ncbi:hypothetical protein [Streptomyces sp. NPDC001380]|uniref:hypothetical protein n=1 Tax=Streptomyces sp. NPDC001380 TaxID=3364566 RepID=UPI0036CE4A1D